MDDSRLAALRDFAVLARRLSFRAAADELEIDATVLSRRIARLEVRLGVRLLHRTTRRVTLTEAGAVLQARADDLLTRLADAEAEVSRYAAEPTGTLRLAMPNVFGQRWIAPILPEFMARHPALRLELSFGDRMVDLVEQGFDAAIRIGALDAGGDLVVRKLATNARVLCAAPAYLAAHGTPRHPRTLVEHRTLHFAPLLGGAVWRLRGSGGVVEVPITPVLRADNIEALRHAALAGLGIALIATSVADEDLAAGRLVPILTDWRLPESDVSIVYPNAPFVPRKVRALVAFLSERFSAGPPWERSRPS